MKLTRRKRDSIWLVVCKDQEGHWRKISTGARDPDAARRVAPTVLNRVLGEPREKSEGSTKAPSCITLSEAFHRTLKGPWRNSRAYKTLLSNIKILEQALGPDKDIRDINYHTLLGLAEEWRSRGYAEATVRRKFETLKVALKHIIQTETSPSGEPYMHLPSFPKVTLDNLRERFMTRDEERQALATIARLEDETGNRDWSYLRALVVFLLDTGARLGEALSARAEYIDGTRIVFPRYKTKTKKPRPVPLSRRVREEIEWLKQASPDGRLFPLDTNKVWRMWRQVRDEVPAIDDVNIHILRHTCASRLLQGGVPLYKVSSWLGHANLNITWERYSHLADEGLDDGLEALEDDPKPN